MPNDDLLTDDYVAGVLAQEANDYSLRYSAMGVEALKSDKKPANMLKPNKRFLRHIIKDTDHHNKNLLAKEAAESKARLKDLERAEDVKRRKTNPNQRDIRKRQMGDIQAILGGKKRSADDEEEEAPARKDKAGRKESRDSKGERGSVSGGKGDLFGDRQGCRSHHGRLSREEHGESKNEDSSRRKASRRQRSVRHEDSDSNDDKHARRSRKSRHKSRSRSRSPGYRKSKHRTRSPITDNRRRRSSPKGHNANESDPLDDIIGPAPPPRYRGRGARGESAGMDRRFSESYDPKTDVQMNEDEARGGDWDDAVEAFRDQQKLKQHQEARLREAGFSVDQIQKAKNSQDDKIGDSFTWSKAGEKREWDRGK